ncbi:MAG: hypothetical protein ACKV0T_30340 [Planctomycetales bacterium]
METSAGQTVRSVRELMLEPQEQQILQLVAVDPTSIDEICRGSGLETSRVLATLTVLEMRRVIRRLPGSQYCRVD